jgi:hypothetical protein
LAEEDCGKYNYPGIIILGPRQYTIGLAYLRRVV